MGTFSFCPLCAHSLVKKIPEYDHVERLVCNACGYVHYFNSVPTATAIIINDNKEILIVKRLWHPFKDHWDLPGGFLENGEHPRDGVVREIKEELSIDIEPELTPYDMIMDHWEHPKFTEKTRTLQIFYKATILSGTPIPTPDEIGEVQWLPLESIPKIVENIAFEANQKTLTRLHQEQKR